MPAGGVRVRADVFRRLVAGAVVTLLAAEALRRAALWSGALRPEGAALLAMSALLLAFVVLAAWCARVLAREDEARRAAVLRGREDLEARVAARTAELELANRALEEQIERNRATERELRASAGWLRAILDYAGYAIISTDPDGVVREFNPAAERLLGYERDDVVGKATQVVFHDPGELAARALELSEELEREIRPGLQSIFARSRAGIADELEWTFVARDGRRIPVLLALSALFDGAGAVTGYLAIASDMTDRKAAREALVRAKDAAEAAMRARSDFLARMSHEIRTPLNGVIGMTELALQTALTAEQRDYLETSRSSANALLALVDDILDFSRMDAGKLRLEKIEFSLRDVIGDALRGLAHRASEKGLELLADVPASVPDSLEGDPHRLRQVLTNLVGNAIKFTDRGEIVVRAEAPVLSDREVQLELHVIDSGIGVAAETQQRIFEAFSQAEESISRRYGGVGLGLSICTQIAQLMGGSVGLQSQLGRGSDFWLRVPLARCSEPTRAPAAALVGMRALVADPNETSRRILIDLLSSWGMAPEPVEPDRVIEIVQCDLSNDSPVRVVILDAREPATDDIARALAREQSDAVTVVVLTSPGVPGGSRTGGDLIARVARPVSEAALLEAIEATAIAERRTLEIDVRAAWDERGHGTSMRVLVAEDNAVNRSLITRILERAGHEVVAVDDGRKALTALAHEPFDVVLMDLQMPVMDGFEATRTIRAGERESGARVPIVALTAQAMTGDRQRCLDAGMDDYVPKPVQADVVLDTIARVTCDRRPGACEREDEPLAREELLARAQGDSELAQELLDLFVDDLGGTLGELESAERAGERLAVSRLAHRLRGAALTVGAHETAQAAHFVEALALSARDDELHDALGALERAARRLVVRIEEEVAA